MREKQSKSRKEKTAALWFWKSGLWKRALKAEAGILVPVTGRSGEPEVSLHEGGSLKVWRELTPPATEIEGGFSLLGT